MTHLTSISFDDEVYYAEQFQHAKRERRLSRIINDLLRDFFEVSKQSTPSNKSAVQDELRKIAAREALLKDKMADLEKAEEEEKTRYKVLE